MSEQEISPYDEERLSSEKKLRKREKKLRERLQEAERAQADALGRLRDAEARMRKRMARVQQLEERLNNVHQHLGALQAPRATVVTLITAGTEAFAPLLASPPPSPVIEHEEATFSEATTENVSNTSPISSFKSEADKSEADKSETDKSETDKESDGGTAQTIPVEAEPAYQERFADTHVLEVSLLEDDSDEEEEESMETFLAQELAEEDAVNTEVSVDDVVKKARKARAVAEAAEEAARDAIERVAEAEEYLEQLGSARHLMQELERLHADADRAKVRACEAQEAARIAEQPLAKPPQEEQQREIVVVSSVEDKEQTEAVGEMGMNDVASFDEPGGHPSELEKVGEIAEEEEDLETVTAMIIADAAGIAAVRAEALAEACSARTREARQLALKADQALEVVRIAIRMQKLSGEGAEVALRAAEREATYAHAALADAEAAEERALNAATNAEAEAEVAEGMAFATRSRSERDERIRSENASLQSASSTTLTPALVEQDEDDEDTLEVPVIRPKRG